MVAALTQELAARRIMKRLAKHFALCLDNSGNEASLIPGKIYRMVPDAQAAKDDLIRVIDESGEDSYSSDSWCQRHVFD